MFSKGFIKTTNKMADRPNCYKHQFLIVVLLVVSVSAAQDACSQWASIASAMTSKQQSCTNDKTNVCTRLDCSGRVSFTHSELFDYQLQFDYCFGTQLNSCNSPVSLDFYLQVPDKNVNLITRINQDTLVDIPGISVPIGPLGHVQPKLKFQFERKADYNILYSVTLLVYMVSSGSMYEVDQMRRILIEDETIHSLPCAKFANDTASVPSQEFNSSVGKCSWRGDSSSSTPVPLPSDPTPKPYSPSATLNKTCNAISQVCGHLEMCDSASQTCKCIPEATLSPAKDACLTFSQIGMPCTADADCSIVNERCSGSYVQGQRTCQCVEGYRYSHRRESCVFALYTEEYHVDSTTAKIPERTATEVEAEENTLKHNLPIIIGASLSGAILVVLLVWLALHYQHRRRRQQLSVSSDESRAPMLGHQDDDNLIM